MFPKNLCFAVLADPDGHGARALLANLTEEALETVAAKPLGEFETATSGFDFVRDGQRMFEYQGHILLHVTTEKKSVPASAIKKFVKRRCAELEKGQGFPATRTQRKEAKIDAKDELLPRAIPTSKTVAVFIDKATGIITMDVSSNNDYEMVCGLLYGAAELQTKALPAWPGSETVTGWLSERDSDEGEQILMPEDLTADDSLTLEHPGEEGKTVKYDHTNLLDADVLNNFELGAHVKAVALTWKGGVSFVWKQDGTLGKARMLDVLKDKPKDPDVDKFQNDFFLAADTIRQLTKYMIEQA